LNNLYQALLEKQARGDVLMTADTSYLNHVIELLEPIGDIKSRAMFGGYGIFHEGDMFALISGSTLYFKVNESNRAAYENADSKPFRPMPYYEVPAEIMEDTASLYEWARTSIAIGHATAKKKRR
jgi:DNA transformation protein